MPTHKEHPMSKAADFNDRMLSLGRFAPRPVRSGGPTEVLPRHIHGKVITRRQGPLPK